jgi:hypothetical protein
MTNFMARIFTGLALIVALSVFGVVVIGDRDLTHSFAAIYKTIRWPGVVLIVVGTLIAMLAEARREQHARRREREMILRANEGEQEPEVLSEQKAAGRAVRGRSATIDLCGALVLIMLVYSMYLNEREKYSDVTVLIHDEWVCKAISGPAYGAQGGNISEGVLVQVGAGECRLEHAKVSLLDVFIGSRRAYHVETATGRKLALRKDASAIVLHD